eukprot:900110-Prorocentrum_minimum.AAC.2
MSSPSVRSIGPAAFLFAEDVCAIVPALRLPRGQSLKSPWVRYPCIGRAETLTLTESLRPEGEVASGVVILPTKSPDP